MIDFRLAISNPWYKADHEGEQKDYAYVEKQLSKNKTFELQISKWAGVSNFLLLRLDTCWFGSDHAGPELWVELFGYSIIVKLYDHRHWNYDAGRFQTYEEAEAKEWEESQKETKSEFGV